MLEVDVTRVYQSRLLFQQVLVDITHDALTHIGRDFYQRLLEKALTVIPGAEAGSVLMRAENNCFRYRAVVGFPLERLNEVSFPGGAVEAWYKTPAPRLMYHRKQQTVATSQLGEAAVQVLRDYGRINDLEVTLSVPVLLRERLVAVLNLDSFQPNEAFDREAISRAEAIAAHVAVALERARLEQQVNNHSLQRERFREMLLKALAETDEIAFLRYVLDQVTAMVAGAQAGSVFFKSRQDSYHIVAAVGYALENVASYAFRKQELELTVDTETFMPSLVYDISNTLDTMSRKQTVSAFHEVGDVERIKVTLVMPIVVEGNLVATIYLDNFDDPHAFDDTLDAAYLLTTQMGVFLQRFKIEQQNRQRVRYQEALLAVLKQALGTRDDVSFYQYVLKQAINTIPGAQKGSTVAKDPELRYVFVAAEGYDLAVLQTTSFTRHPEPLTAAGPVQSSYVLKKDLLAAHNDLHDDEQKQVLAQAGNVGQIHASLMLPIYASVMPSEHPEAIMYLDNFEDEQAFDEDAIQVAEGLANQISEVLTRLHLQRMHKQNARQQRLLTDIEALLLRINDIYGFFPALADRLLREDAFDIAFIELFYLTYETQADLGQTHPNRRVHCEVFSRDPAVQRVQQAVLEPIVATLHDLPNPFMSLSKDDIASDDTVYINDLAQRSGWGVDEAWYVAEGVTAKAVQVLPLLRKGQVWGRCNIFFRRPYAQPPLGDSFARKVVGSIAVALDKQADREALEREVVRMRAVVAANDALRDTFSQEDVFQQTVRSAERHAHPYAVWLFYVHSEQLSVLSRLEQNGVGILADCGVLADYVVAKAGQHESSLLERACNLAARVFKDAVVCGEQLSDVALLAVPLITEQRRVPGVLVIATDTISQSDSAFAEALAQASSSALMRLELVTARAQEAAAYRALANFGATIEAINDVDTLMQLGIKQLMAQLELEAAHAYDVLPYNPQQPYPHQQQHYQQGQQGRQGQQGQQGWQGQQGRQQGHQASPQHPHAAYHAQYPRDHDAAELDATTGSPLLSPSPPLSSSPLSSSPPSPLSSSPLSSSPLSPLSSSLSSPLSSPLLQPAGVWGVHPPGFNAYFRQPLRPTSGVLTEVLKSKQLRYLDDYQHYSRAIQPHLDFGLRTLLIIPVLQGGEIVKLISLSSYKNIQPLSDERLAIARSFVRRLENAIERVDNVREVESTREATLRALGLALEYRDFETKGHSERVVDLSLALGDALGFDPRERQALRWGAYLHDIGKVGVPDSILLKPSSLTQEEFAAVKKHTLLGYSLCRDIPFLPAEATAVVRSHHERWDGSGYPDGLAGERIPLMARLFSLVDVYDALTNPRVYKHAWEVSRALQEIRHLSGKQFDPELTHVFLELLEKRRR